MEKKIDKHLSLKDFLFFHHRVLDVSGGILFERGNFIAQSDANRIREHLMICEECRQKAIEWARENTPAKKKVPANFYWRRYTPVAAVLLLSVGAFFFFNQNKTTTGVVVRSTNEPSHFLVNHKNNAIGHIKMAPYSEINIPTHNEPFHKVRLSEGEAQVTIERTGPSYLDIVGDRGVVRVSWLGKKSETRNEPVLQFSIVDRDERRGSPDFFVQVEHGELAIENTQSGKSAFRSGDAFTVSKNSEITPVY
ncbi:MAG TPA: hypothetical protein PLY93_10765 [Turneriella sp.]|nr:hypothetical protein [Turneriella sp.]